MRHDYDLIVIGAGNAGQAAAGTARKAGWSVLVIEARDVGGTCPLRGCVPKKVLVAAAETLDQIARAHVHAIRVSKPALDWKKLIARKQRFVAGVPATFEKGLRQRGIDVVHGRARFVDAHGIDVAGQRFNGKKILVAAGSKPRPLAIPGGELAITSDDILDMKRRPASLVFIGAGVIALEFAHVFARAGTRVTMLELMPRPLPFLDADAVAVLTEATRKLGVRVLTDVQVERIERKKGRLFVRYTQGGKHGSISADCAVNGAGRVPDLEDLDLDAAGVARDAGRPELDEFLRSRSNRDVFFAGDANPGAPQLSPVATYEGQIVGHNLTSEAMRAPDYRSIPSVIFAIPALASVGLTEERARRDGHDFDAVVKDMRDWRSARTYAETAAYAKVLIGKENRQILGAHLVGHGAAELIHSFALVMKHGLGAGTLTDMVYAYPTFSSDIRFLV